MTLNQLERTISINPFRGGIEIGSRPENIKDVTVEISEKVNSVFEEFKKAYSLLYDEEKEFNKTNYVYTRKLDVLLPSEIDLVMQSIIMRQDTYNLNNHVISCMVSRLIKDSYKAGNNNFILTTNNCLINNLFMGMRGIEKNPVIATVIGNAGNRCGYDSEYCILDVKGNAGHDLGFESKNCVYTIHGNVGDSCGSCSKEGVYDILGDAQEWMGADSHNSVYNVLGEVGNLSGIGAYCCTFNLHRKVFIDFDVFKSKRDCVFKVRDQESYETLCKNLFSNKIYLLDKDDNMIMERK